MTVRYEEDVPKTYDQLHDAHHLRPILTMWNSEHATEIIGAGDHLIRMQMSRLP
jgi:hypothetical protein